VTRDGVKPSPEKVRAIPAYPRPHTVKDVRAFLGLSGYYRQYIPRYAEISRPLTHLTKKDQEFHWTTEQEQAFERLKTALSSERVLAYPRTDPAHEFQLHTDASDQRISAVLTQIQNGQERPISYASRQLNTAEKKLALIFGTKQYRCYLYGRKVILVSDHRALCWLLKLQYTSAKLTL
jgi:hypothetical protein